MGAPGTSLTSSLRPAGPPRTTGALRAVDADGAAPDDRARLAREATALTETLDAQIDELGLVDAGRPAGPPIPRARGRGRPCADALAARHAACEAPEPEVTALEWLAVIRRSLLTAAVLGRLTRHDVEPLAVDMVEA